MLPLYSFICSIPSLVKKCMNYDGVGMFFYKKEQHVYRNKLIIVYYYSLKYTMKCTGGQIKAFCFCTTSDAKSTKGGEH